tara:strand:- start:299 stop:679 length:381 start_codon:yes stop_codon:yes gene_type:complete
MSGLSPKLPVRRDPADGFALTKTYAEMIKQNLKNLVLTSPGERMMDIEFGVGIRDFLFEQNISSVRTSLEGRIRTQVLTYMPFVEIRNVLFFPESVEHPNRLKLAIQYFVIPVSTIDALSISIDLV